MPLELAHVQPQAPEIEKAVLGALMIDRDAYMEVSNLLRIESFYEPRNQMVYEAIVKLSADESQGVIFLMEAANDCAFVNLIWPWCYSFSKFDIDELARVQKVANDINARGVISAFYSITDSDDVAVHLKKNFLLVQQIPDLEDYLRLLVDSFFRTARMLELEVKKRRMQECENHI